MSKILLTANSSWYLYNFRASTIKALQEQGHSVICLSPKDEFTHNLIHDYGCAWINLRMDANGINPFKDLLLFVYFLFYFLKTKPIVVFSFTVKNNIYGSLACSVCRIKAVTNVSGLGTTFIRKNLITKVVKFLYKISQRGAYVVCCQNPDDQDFLTNNNLVCEKKVHLLPGSGVNISRFNPSIKLNKRSEFGFQFLYVGRMLEDKGVNELIQAADKLASGGFSFTLNLCGFVDVQNVGSLSLSEIKTLSTNKKHINWLGSSDLIEKVYAASDCVVLPSYREGMPRTLLEAGAMGLPSIASNVPGCKHVINHGVNGLLCTVKSVQSLYEQLKAMVTMPEEIYNKMCQNSRILVVEKYDERIIVEHALSVVRKLKSSYR